MYREKSKMQKNSDKKTENDTEKKQQDSTLNTENVKNLIKETITGRKMTPDRLAKSAGAAALCGAAFGLAAALTFCGVSAISNMAAENAARSEAEKNTESDAENGQQESDAALPQEESSGSTAGEGTGAGNDGNASGESSGEAVTEGESTSQHEEGASGDNRPKYMRAYDSIMELREKVVRDTAKYMVNINATSTGTTWFENVASSTRSYAGVIISVGDDEILILTSAEAAESESLRVSFENSVTVDAYVKQVSTTDDLAVLAVSAKNGMEDGMLKDMESIEFASMKAVKNGEPVIAVGAPLGAVGSYSFGDISYINEAESGFDVEQSVFYADLNTDAEKGTFIVDCEGRLIGIASADPGSTVSGTTLSRIISSSSLLSTISYLKRGRTIAYAGIKGAEVSFDMRYSGMPEGVYVTDVAHDSAAYNAGIMRGDIISEIDDQEISDMEELTRALRKCEPGDEIKLAAKRSGQNGSYTTVRFTLTLGSR